MYFRPEKEEKLKLIIGERLLNAYIQKKLLNAIKSCVSEEISKE